MLSKDDSAILWTIGMVLFEGVFGILIRLVSFSSVTNYYLMV